MYRSLNFLKLLFLTITNITICPDLEAPAETTAAEKEKTIITKRFDDTQLSFNYFSCTQKHTEFGKSKNERRQDL